MGTITTPEELQLKRAALTIRGINHKLRIEMFNYLLHNPKKTVTEIYQHFKIEQSVASQQLAIMRKEGFVIAEKDKRFVFYSANRQRLDEVLQLCEQITKK